MCLCFFTFTMSINLVISAFLHFRTSESRKCRIAEIQNAEIDKSLEISKVKKHKQIAYVFSLLLCRLIRLSLHFCSSAFPRFRKWEMQKCGDAKCRNIYIARNFKSEKTYATCSCFSLFIFRLIWLFSKIAYDFQK